MTGRGRKRREAFTLPLLMGREAWTPPAPRAGPERAARRGRAREDEEDFEDADAYASYDIGDAMTAEMSNTSGMSANVKNLQFQVGVTYWFM